MKRQGWVLCMLVALLTLVGCKDEPEFKRPFPVPEPVEPSRPLDAEIPESLKNTPATPVPHTIDEVLPITKGMNRCLDCHFDPEAAETGERKPEGEAQPIPASHYLSLPLVWGDPPRQTFGQAYFCVPCHAQAKDARPLPPIYD